MSILPPLSESDAPEESRQTFDRIKDMLGADAVPDVFVQLGHVPAFLKDVYMNFKKFVWSEGKLDRRTKALVAYAIAAHANGKPWMDFLADHARSLEITDEQLREVVAVVSINATYNAFFKFRSIAGSEVFEGMPVGLRAHTFSSVSLEESTVELISVAISDVNACKPCVAGHVAKARKLEVSNEAILETIQCAATMLAAVQYAGTAAASGQVTDAPTVRA